MKKTIPSVPIHNIETKEMHAMGFDIIDLQGKSGKQYDSSLLHRHTFFELFFFTGGTGDHQIDFLHYPVAKNSVHFVSPGQIHKLTLKRTQGYVLCFTEDFISLQANESFIEKFPFYDSAHYPVINLNRTIGNMLATLVNTINTEFSAPGNTTDILRSYLNILLLKIRSCFSQTQENNIKHAPNKSAKVVLFRNLINTDYLLHKSVSDYASALNISPNHLNALCKLHEGKTAIQLLQERLLLESKRLLYATDMNVKEISFHLKFEDVAYFNRFFKKQARVTPVRYRVQSQTNR
jgi:AraC family transcriptional activator of pobA